MSTTHPAQVLDTPARPSNIRKTEYSTVDLATRRASVLASVGPSVPQVDIDLFFKYLLPTFPNGPITEEKFDEICEAVLASHYIDGRWTTFPKDPADSKKESTVFNGLIPIARAVEGIVRTKLALEPTVTLDNNLDRVPESTWRANTTRPDGYFILRQPQYPGPKPHWMNVVFPGEYKRKNDVSNINDDIAKTIWSSHHIMREDPHRLFTFGSTLENRTMRLWYAGRAEVVVSDPFDFVSNPKLLLRFFVTVMYAKPESLGWDPTMKLVRDSDEKVQHEITVFARDEPRPRVFRTTRLISNIGACAIRGRGTRVWEVVELDDNGEPAGLPMVLKDSWPDSDRPREMDVLGEMLKDIGHEENMKKYFLTTVAAGDVVFGGATNRTLSEQERTLLQARGDGKATRTFNLRQVDFSDRAISKMNKKHESLKQELPRSPACSYSTMQGENERLVQYSPKTHHRIVFKEVCESLYEQVDLTTIFRALHNVCDPLERMHEAGWVHRDISAGNILILRVNDSLQVKISDLEYAKRYGQAGALTHEVRTGTQDFMSVEVYEQGYLFEIPATLPARPNPVASSQSEGSPDYASKSNLSSREIDSDSETESESELPTMVHGGSPVLTPKPSAKNPALPLPQSMTVFTYNPLHDCESVLWLMTFFTVNKDVRFVARNAKTEPPTSLTELAIFRSARLTKQARFAESLFSSGHGRWKMFKAARRAVDNDILGCIHPALGQVAASLNNIRAHLIVAYTEAERGTAPIDHKAAANVYEELRNGLRNAIKATKTKSYRVQVPCSISQALHNDQNSVQVAQSSGASKLTKRKPEDDSDEDAKALEGLNRESDDDTADGVDTQCDDSSQAGRKRARTAE